MHETVPLSKIDPNPFRRIERYPIKGDKIEALMASMDRTGFWDNVVARRVGDRYQLAYGHHRRVAFERKFGKAGKMNLIVRDIGDADMLRIMADENMQEFGHAAEIEQETVRAVVAAYAEGKLDDDPRMRKPDGKTNEKHIRYAPSFLLGCSTGAVEHPYTAQTIADFLGWTKPTGQAKPAVYEALEALEKDERGLIDLGAVADLSRVQVREIAAGAEKIVESYEEVAKAAPTQKQAEKIRAEARREAQAAVASVAGKLREQKAAEEKGSVVPRAESYGVRAIAEDMTRRQATRPGEKAPPSVEKFCGDFARELLKAFTGEDRRFQKVNELIRYRDDIDPDVLREVVVAWEGMLERGGRLLDSLRGGSRKRVTVTRKEGSDVIGNGQR